MKIGVECKCVVVVVDSDDADYNFLESRQWKV
jgi:hypothetical protein